MAKLNYEYNQDTDIMVIEGIRYSASIFRRGFGGFGLREGQLFRIEKREGGDLTIRSIDESKCLPACPCQIRG